MGSLALVYCLSGGYRFASVLRCVGLVIHDDTSQYKMIFIWKNSLSVIRSVGIISIQCKCLVKILYFWYDFENIFYLF